MNNVKILVVNDDKQQLDTLAGALSYAGYNCCKAVTIQEAFDWLEAIPDIKVVLRDISASDCDRVNFISHIRDRFPGRPWIQSVLITTSASSETVDEALRAGAADLLFKPIRREALLTCVNEAIVRAKHARIKSVRLQSELKKYSNVGENASLFYPSAKELELNDTHSDRATNESASLSLIDDDKLLQFLEISKVKSRIFGEKLFLEVSWNMLIELMASKFTNNTATLSQVYAVSGAPIATASRRLAEMEAAGIVQKYGDPKDARRQFVRITTIYADKLRLYFTLMSRNEHSSFDLKNALYIGRSWK